MSENFGLEKGGGSISNAEARPIEREPYVAIEQTGSHETHEIIPASTSRQTKGNSKSEAMPEPEKKKGVIASTIDWVSWGIVATLGQAAKNVVETAAEAGVYAGALYGAVYLAKMATFAPLVAMLGPLFVPAAAFFMVSTFFTIFNIAAIASYDKMKVDALGYERIKRLRKYAFFRTIVDPVIFTALCIWDPLDAVLYARDGSEEYNGMKGKDWRNLAVSTVISNAFWLTGVGAVLRLFALL